MSSLKQVKIQAKRLGFDVEASRPGDGRVRVYLTKGSIQRSFVGSYAAECFLDGFEAAGDAAVPKLRAAVQGYPHFYTEEDDLNSLEGLVDTTEKVLSRMDDERSSLACEAASSQPF